jgi:uncharacterized membrane protein
MTQESQSTAGQTTAKRAGMIYTIVQIVLSALGTIDAGLLWLQDTKRVDLPCTSDGGCEKVANSIYSQVHIFGKPVEIALIGIIGYVLLLSLSMAKAASETTNSVRMISLAILLISGGAFLYSWYLQYVSFTIIHAHCMYCIISACIMSALFITSVLERRALSRSILVRGPSGEA